MSGARMAASLWAAPRTQIAQHDFDHVGKVGGSLPWRHQVAPEYRGKRVSVGKIEAAQAGDHDVEAHWIHIAPEYAGVRPALEQPADHLEQRRAQFRNRCRPGEVAALMQVLAVQEANEFRMGKLKAPRELDQPAHAIRRLRLIEFETLLGLAYDLVGAFEHRQEQVVLAAEVVIEHPHVDAGLRGDPVDTRSTQTRIRKLLGRRSQDLLTRTLSVPDRGSLCAACGNAKGLSSGHQN